MAAYRGCRAVPVRSAQWRSHGPIQRVPIRRRGTRPGGCGGRGINHLVAVARPQPVPDLLGGAGDLVAGVRHTRAGLLEELPEPLAVEVDGVAGLGADVDRIAALDVLAAHDAVVVAGADPLHQLGD